MQPRAAYVVLLALTALGAVSAHISYAGSCDYPYGTMGQWGGSGNGGFNISVFNANGSLTSQYQGSLMRGGQMYTVTFQNNHTNYGGFLFQAVKGIPGTPNNHAVGNFSQLCNYCQCSVYTCTPKCSFATHNKMRYYNQRNSDTFGWLAPPAGTGPVTFHLLGVIDQTTWFGRITPIIYTLTEIGSTARFVPCILITSRAVPPSPNTSSSSGPAPFLPCPNNCSTHGLCIVGSGVCACADGWLGSDCSVARAAQLVLAGSGATAYTLDWTVSGGFIYVTASLPAGIWGGIGNGASDADGMSHADIWVVTTDDDATAAAGGAAPSLHDSASNTTYTALAATCTDMWAVKQGPPDTTHDVTQDCQQCAGYQSQSSSSAAPRASYSFRRALVTGDPGDHPIAAGTVHLTWAFGTTPVLAFHHSNAGGLQVDFVSGQGRAVSEDQIKLLWAGLILLTVLLLVATLRTGCLASGGLSVVLLHKRIGAPAPPERRSIFHTLTFDVIPALQDSTVGEVLLLLAYLGALTAYLFAAATNYQAMGRDLRLVLGQLTAVHLTLALLFPTRNSLWVRLLSLPVERALRYHRGLARVAVGLVVAHGTTMILLNGKYILHTDPTFEGEGNLYGLLAGITFVLVALTAMPAVRRAAFEFFLTTHRLALVGLGLAMTHSRTFRYLAIAPLALYGLDLVIRWRNSARPVKVLSASSLPYGTSNAALQGSLSTVSRLVLRVGSGFRYRAGDYVFVNVPDISSTEWHPFSISSAPRAAGAPFSLHVMSMGAATFTGQLHDRLADLSSGKLTVAVDGPYGALGVELHEYPLVILVGGGIGATPLISVVGDLWSRSRAGVLPALRAVHFIWVCSSPLPFARWFAETLGPIVQAGGESQSASLSHSQRNQPAEHKASDDDEHKQGGRASASVNSASLQRGRFHFHFFHSQSAAVRAAGLLQQDSGAPVFSGADASSTPASPALPSGSQRQQSSFAPPPQKRAARTDSDSDVDHNSLVEQDLGSNGSGTGAAPTIAAADPRRALLAGSGGRGEIGYSALSDESDGAAAAAAASELDRGSSFTAVMQGVPVESGRPDLSALFDSLPRSVGLSVPRDGARVAVLACGPSSLLADVQAQCNSRDLHLHKETFLL